MITNKNEAKTVTKHISCDCKCKFISTACNSNQEITVSAKKDYSQNPSKCIFENSKYLKSAVDTSVIACNEVISVIDIVSKKKTNTIATNVTRIVSINCYSKKVRYNIDFCILHTALLMIILLLISTIICYHYVKHRSKQKGIDALTM